MAERIFVSGIGTDVGKTIASAILMKYYQADYWKPIQAGDLANSDTHKVAKLAGSAHSYFPETFQLTQPLSPHAAAKHDKLDIRLKDFRIPKTDKTLIIEGAGGLMVPLNQNDLLIDLIKFLSLEVVIVSKHYLGSINHTLLSYSALQAYQIPVLGIIFNGEELPETESLILNYTGWKKLFSIPQLNSVNEQTITDFAKSLRENAKF